MFQRLAISDVVLVKPKRHGDARGYFSETFRENEYAKSGIAGPFVQDNQAFSQQAGILRGLHFQIPPAAQAKLVACTHGAIFDIAVDIRPGSATFGKYVSAELSAENGHQLYVPEGFAHGYLTLTDHCLVQYKVTAYYSPENELGLAWDDPAIDINWPLDSNMPTVSEKDSQLPRLGELRSQLDESAQ